MLPQGNKCAATMPAKNVTYSFGAREAAVVASTSMWSQGSWPLSCPVRTSRKQWLHQPRMMVEASRPLGTQDMLSTTMLPPGRQPPPSVRTRPESPATMLYCGVENKSMKDIVKEFVSVDAAASSASKQSDLPTDVRTCNFKPPTMAVGLSDGYLFLPIGSPASPQIRPAGTPKHNGMPGRQLRRSPSWASNDAVLDGRATRPPSAYSAPSPTLTLQSLAPTRAMLSSPPRSPAARSVP